MIRRLAAVACVVGVAAGVAVPAGGQAPAVSTLTGKASPPVTRRGQIRDTAVLSVAGAAGGTISFSVFGPGDPACAGPPAEVSSAAVRGTGTYTSAPYVAPAAGTYRWVVRYSGDAGHPPAATPCGDPAQAVVVTNPPAPVLGRSFQVGPLRGRIYVRPAGAAAAAAAAKGVGFVPLVESRTLPVGSAIDARGGVARITTAVSGGVQVGDFGGGDFKLLQSRRELGLASLDLVVGKAAAASSCGAHAAAARPLSARVLALLRASATGRFRTRGRFSSATVRGTVWDTIDRCDGTLTRVRRGVVLVTDVRRQVSVLVRAGRSYLARAAAG